MKKEKVIKGIALLITLVFVIILGIGAVAIARLHSTEISLVRRQNNSTRAFYIAEGGLERAVYDLKKDFENDSSWANGNINNIPDATTSVGPDNTFYSLPYADNLLGGGNYVVELRNVVDGAGGSLPDEIWVKSIGTDSAGTVTRTVVAKVKPHTKIPGAVYSKGVVKIRFEKLRKDGTYRDTCAFIDGGSRPGIYSTDEVTSKREGEGRILGNPPILENQEAPGGLQDGIWDAFDINALREIAKANGTYFSADETDDEYNNPYNKRGKYTLPVELDDGTKISEGVFFFDAKNGEPLDDELEPRNRIKVKLEGTNAVDPVSGEPIAVRGVIVVVGDLKIKDTNNYDFLFDGVILVLNDLKIDDGKNHRRGGTNDSDIFIKGAVLSDNVIEKRKRRKKEKPAIDIKNATIEYDKDAVTNALSSYTPVPISSWAIIPESWQEM